MSTKAFDPKHVHTWRFAHIPKNAGTSFIQVYGRGSPEQTVKAFYEGGRQDYLAYPGGHHAPASFFPESLRPVAILRNPFDRIVSIAAYIHRGIYPFLTPGIFTAWMVNGMPLRLNYPGKPLVEVPPVWVPPKDEPINVSVAPAGPVFVGPHKPSQAALTLLSPQVAWLRRGTVLLLYEALEDSLRALAPTIGTEYRPLPILNVSKRYANYRVYYTANMLRTIRERFPDDIKLWEAIRKDYDDQKTSKRREEGRFGFQVYNPGSN